MSNNNNMTGPHVESAIVHTHCDNQQGLNWFQLTTYRAIESHKITPVYKNN